jgi:hypothetical protein
MRAIIEVMFHTAPVELSYKFTTKYSGFRRGLNEIFALLDVMQRGLRVIDVLGQIFSPIFKVKAIKQSLGCFNLQDGTMSINVGKPPINPQVGFNKLNLEYTAETKFLGIHITGTLKWNSHVQSSANRLNKVSFMIKSSKGILSPYMIRNVYLTKFQALPRFGVLFWGRIGGELSIRIFRIQNGDYVNGWSKFKNVLQAVV